MSTQDEIEFEFKAGARQDMALVALETIVCSVLAIRFEWTERFFAWTRRWESLELDEIAFVLLALAIGLAWFSLRRWRAAQRELDRRMVLEAVLTRTLAERQHEATPGAAPP